MSASLVGSEMCIRDRRICARRPYIPVMTDSCSLGSSVALCQAGCAPGCPVSYTHLTLPTICSV
eukprot:12025703-Alexandrium_andersonii.AAC.1